MYVCCVSIKTENCKSTRLSSVYDGKCAQHSSTIKARRMVTAFAYIAWWSKNSVDAVDSNHVKTKVTHCHLSAKAPGMGNVLHKTKFLVCG